MWKLTGTAAAGYVLNVGAGAQPGLLAPSERDLLRELARQVAQIAADPKQETKRHLWYRHNALEPTRPLVLVFPEDSWTELLPIDQTVTIADAFWGQWEWYLKHLIFRNLHLEDDFVVEPDLYVPLTIRSGDSGIEPAEMHNSGDPNGAYAWSAPLQDPDDIEKLIPAAIEIDAADTDQRITAVHEVLGNILPVHQFCAPSSFCLIDVAAHLRGTVQLMLDMYDRPDWVHRLMQFLGAEELRRRRFLQAQDVLTLNNRNHYVDSGGIGYTRELPRATTAGDTVQLSDLWCHAAAQAASEIGPAQHDEFILEHELPILKEAGLVAYGCCEPYTHKFDMLFRRVPNLRRVSVSPWCDVTVAADALQDRCVFSWKPNPAMLVGAFAEDRIRAYVRKTMDVAQNCRLEIILKDTITLDNDPSRLTRWIRIVREEITRTHRN